MSTIADSLVASTARKLAIRMRPDLIVRRQVYQGRASWAVKEPLGPAYFRFNKEDYAVLEMLDGRSSLEEIKNRFEQRFPHLSITTDQLWQFISSLHRGNLLVSDAPEQGWQLKKRRDERKRKELLGKFTNVLAIRFRGFDPERLLNWLYPKVRWAYSPAVIAIVCLTMLSALLLIAVQFEVFVSRLPSFHQFFGFKNAVWLILALVISKILHEFGHGLTCKHFGGECHEIGILVLVLTPCLYCNVSDSWMLPNKWHRAAIGAAGMYVEVALASICTFVWWFSEPGMLNHLCLYFMFISSVSTILFNANPLLRFDGYYILSDVMEIPNLRQKSTSVLQRTLGWWCLGLEPPHDRYLPQRQKTFFIVYSLAAAVYRWFIVFFILLFLQRVFAPYRLEIIGQLIATAAIVGLVVVPLWKLAKFFWVPGRIEKVKKPRLVISLCLLTGIVLAFLLIPLPYSVICPLEIKLQRAESVYVKVPGSLKRVHVSPGDYVKKGEPLAELANVDLELEIDQLTRQRNSQALQLKTLRRQRFKDPQALAQIPQVEQALASTKEQLEKRFDDRRSLSLAAPRAGYVFPPPALPEKAPRDGRLPGWSGTPLDKKNLGCHLESKVLFCQVGDPSEMEAVLVIDQSDLEFIRKGERVEMKLDLFPDMLFHGTIATISQSELRFTPPQLSSKAGGELDTKTDESGGERPQNPSYQARVALQDSVELLRLGLRGRAKIHVAKRTLGQRIWRYLSQTFRFGGR